MPEHSFKREPRALTSEYHKAHKQLMLWSAVLFIWELVGVDLNKARDAGGNVGPIVTALKSPQAIPWVPLILVVYFLFKCSIEWAQCHKERRKIGVARFDFISSWIVAIAAITLYVGQAISRTQFANSIHGSFRSAAGISGFMIAGWAVLVTSLIAWPTLVGRIIREYWILLLIPLSASAGWLGTMIFSDAPVSLNFVLLGFLLGVPTIGLPTFFILRRLSNKAALAKN